MNAQPTREYTFTIQRISLVNPKVFRLLIVFTDGRKLEISSQYRAYYAEFETLAKAGKRLPIALGIESYELKG